MAKTATKFVWQFLLKVRANQGGARVITHIRLKHNFVYLLDIYDKSDKETLSETEINWLLLLLEEQLEQTDTTDHSSDE